MGADQADAAGAQSGMPADTQTGMQDEGAGADGQDAVDRDAGEQGTEHAP
jgi:hypothetical protein